MHVSTFMLISNSVKNSTRHISRRLFSQLFDLSRTRYSSYKMERVRLYTQCFTQWRRNEFESGGTRRAPPLFLSL